MLFTKKTAVAGVILSGLAISTALADGETTKLLHNPYQQGSTEADCTNSGFCEVTFPATTDADTVVTAISCLFALPQGAAISYATFGPDDNLKFYIQPFYYGFSNLTGFNTYGINAQVNLFIKKGEIPAAAVNSVGGAVSGLECTISGYHS